VWGFRRAFVLVDGVDNLFRENEKMVQLLWPLIDQFDLAFQKKLFFKLFLPLELRKDLNETIKSVLPDRLNYALFDATIHWTPNALRQLLIQRFRAAGSQVISNLDMLADDEFAGGLENLVITAAQGSPRRLLMIVSALIDEHIARKPGGMKFKRLDLKRALEIVKLQLGETS
jgi:hypothetical protein